MCERRDGLKAVVAAAGALAQTCAAECRSLMIEQQDAPPLARELRKSFGVSMATPADLKKLMGRMK